MSLSSLKYLEADEKSLWSRVKPSFMVIAKNINEYKLYWTGCKYDILLISLN